MISRRNFMWLTGAAAGLSVTRLDAQRGGGAAPAGPLPPSIAALPSMKSQATPITVDERRARFEQARTLMAEHKIDALMLAGGTSLLYFTGVRWGNSERLFAVVIPAKGEPFCVCPAFENDRAHEQLALGPLASADVRIWQEDESPFERVAEGLKDRGVASGTRRRRGDDEVRLQRQRRRGRARAEIRERDAGHRRLPDDQERARARADAPREPRDAHRLRSRLPRAPARDDAEHGQRADRRGVRQGGLPRLRQHQRRRVHGAAPRLDHAADDPRRHHHHGGRRVQRRGLPVGHHADLRARQGDRQDEEGVRHRPPRAERGAGGGEAGRAAAGGRRGGAQSDRGRGLRARVQVLHPPARATASAWTGTSGRTW